jgi:hypothetical protein
LTRLERQREDVRATYERRVDSFKAERVFRDLMQRTSTGVAVQPADANEAGEVYMDFVAGR